MSEASVTPARPSRRSLITGIAVASGFGPAGLAGTASAAPRPVPASGPERPAALGSYVIPDLGPQVSVFGPDTPTEEIQTTLDELFQRQETDQFGDGRFAVLFLPGTYDIDANVGYYTHVAGLGRSPDDVVINGAVHVEADWFDGNATHNFWRCAENLSVRPTEGFDRWAVSQAAPYRRMHIHGDLVLDDGGWSSGGFMADCRIEGEVRSGSQQQWLTRNTEWGNWDGSNWNMVFVGVNHPPPGQFPDPPFTVVDRTPLIREKPFLCVDGAGEFQVFVPGLRADSAGTTWYGRQASGEALPLGDFLVATPDTPVSRLNAALDEGRHLLLTPGIYRLDDTLRITRPDSVVLGLGLATLMPPAGKAAVTLADVPGVKVAGVLVDADEEHSPVLMEVGPDGSDTDHSHNPTSLHDVFFRIGGPHAAASGTSLVINSNHVLGDHTWLWRGDHGDGIGWTVNPADTGLVVNGDDVTFYGLFAEHYQKYQVIWNGERGRTYFFQSELPYDPPTQQAWMNGDTRGYAAYKVGDSVRQHEAWGLGSYCFFQANPNVVADRAIEVPERDGVRFHHMVAVSLGGGIGTIAHLINDTGGPANEHQSEAFLTEYPAS